MAKHTAALKFLKKSKRLQIPCLRKQLSEPPQELQGELPSPWERGRAFKDSIGAQKAWLKDTREAQNKIRYALSKASKRHDRACIHSNTTGREHASRLDRTGRIFRELLGTRRANRKEILTIGGGDVKEQLYTVDTVHRAFSGHFDKHFGAERKKWYRRSRVHPLFRMNDHGNEYRDEVLQGTANPSTLPSDLREPPQAP